MRAVERTKVWYIAMVLAATAPAPASRTVAAASAAERQTELEYPRIESAGGVYAVVGSPQVPSDAGKLALDVTEPGPVDEIHPGLTHAARALNLYALAGVPEERVAVAVVVHGEATSLALSDEVYRRDFGRANPNARLLRKLEAHGVRVLLCGQSMRQAGYREEDLAATVQLELSAMTTLAKLQDAGYALVP